MDADVYWSRLAAGASFAEPEEDWRRPISAIPPRNDTQTGNASRTFTQKQNWARARLKLDTKCGRRSRGHYAGNVCAVPGCENTLRINNKKGVCLEHTHDPVHCKCRPCSARRAEHARRKAALAADPTLIEPKRRGRRPGLLPPRAR